MPDSMPDNIPEDLTINDQESFVELVLEKWIGIDNVIAEHDEADDDNIGNFEMTKEFNLYTNPIATNFLDPGIILSKTLIARDDFSHSSYIKEISPPPPKV